MTNKMAFVYIFENPELEVRGLVLIYIKEINAMKALRYEGADFMTFFYSNPATKARHILHEGEDQIFLSGGFMTDAICKRASTVQFWDSYAKWYRLWMEHNNYHDRIIEVLTTMVEPGWRILDIGAGNGALSLPLCAIGCDVRAIEPSAGMRNLLYEDAFSKGIDWINVDERRWRMSRRLHQFKIEGIKSRIVFERDHMWLKDTAHVGMYWWKRMS